MQKLVIIGAGGFGREVLFLAERINQSLEDPAWEILGFIDDSVETGTVINGYPVLGNIQWLLNQKTELYAACAIGSSEVRKKIIDQTRKNSNIHYPNLIDPSVISSDSVQIGQGNIICAGNIFTVNIKVENFCIVNLANTIGHDVRMNSYVTVYPGVNISGNVNIGECSELGTGSAIIQGINIGSHSIIGAGSVVIRGIPDKCVAVGSPCKKIKDR